MSQERVTAPDDAPPSHGESIISQSPARKVGDKVFVSVPGPIEVIDLKTEEKRQQRTR